MSEPAGLPEAAPALAELLAAHRVQRAFRIAGPPDGWSADVLAGRFVEISGETNAASLTAAAALVVEAQARDELVAWVAAHEATFFPPDLAESGVDLASLPVIRVREIGEAAQAADELLRSGGFGLVVLDLGEDTHISIAAQTRLAGLAARHHTALVCLTRKGRDAPSLGSLISLRGETSLRRIAFNRFTWEIRILKDKHHGPGWRHQGVCRGSDGLY